MAANVIIFSFTVKNLRAGRAKDGAGRTERPEAREAAAEPPRLSALSRDFRGITATLLFHVPLTEPTSRVRIVLRLYEADCYTITPVQASQQHNP